MKPAAGPHIIYKCKAKACAKGLEYNAESEVNICKCKAKVYIKRLVPQTLDPM